MSINTEEDKRIFLIHPIALLTNWSDAFKLKHVEVIGISGKGSCFWRSVKLVQIRLFCGQSMKSFDILWALCSVQNGFIFCIFQKENWLLTLHFVLAIHLLEKIKKLPHVTAVFLNVERISSVTKVIKYNIKSYSLHHVIWKMLKISVGSILALNVQMMINEASWAEFSRRET